MSHEGKMRRGEFYSNKNPRADNLKSDVEYFLEQSKPKPEPKKESSVPKIVNETDDETDEKEVKKEVKKVKDGNN